MDVIKKRKQSGFTLMEMLVVITILGLLAVIGMGQYKTSQQKAMDSQRKADLSNIARALEMYYNDYGQYPEDNGIGNMVVNTTALLWGGSFETSDAIYMKILPRDPEASATDSSDWDYCYMSEDGTSFELYARLENINDDDYAEFYSTDCGDNYTYVITSSNISEPSPI